MIPAKKGDSKSLAGITLRVEAEEAAASGKSETVAVAVSGGSTGVWTAKFCFLNAWKAETNLPRVELADFRTLVSGRAPAVGVSERARPRPRPLEVHRSRTARAPREGE